MRLTKITYVLPLVLGIFLKNAYAEVPIKYCKEIDNIALYSQTQIDLIASNLGSGVITQSQAKLQVDKLKKQTTNTMNEINKKYTSSLSKDRPAAYECNLLGYKFKSSYYKNQVGYYKCSLKYSGSNYDSCASKVWNDNHNSKN